MKYNFLFKEIGSINVQILNELKVLALSSVYDNNLGFYNGKGIRTLMINDTSKIQTTITSISDILNPSGLLNSYINLVPPGHYIPEHSDSNTEINTIFFQNNTIIHKIHIPIITNEAVGHMWRCKFEENRVVATHFEEGGVYLFNNIDIHSAVNLSSSESRYHLILRYTKESLNDSLYS